MHPFIVNEGVFEIPDGWEDKSITALSFPVGAPKPEASLTVTRETVNTSDQTLAKYVDLQLTKVAKACGGFQLIQRAPRPIGGLPGELVEFTWKTPDGMEVRQLMGVIFYESQSLVITTTAATARFPEFQSIFEGIFSSFRARI